MSLIKKKKRVNISPKKPGKILLTKDYTGRMVQGKVKMIIGNNIETPILHEIIPNYTKCNSCKKFLGNKEDDLADILDYNCIECFEIQIEEEFAVNVQVSPITVVPNIERSIS